MLHDSCCAKQKLYFELWFRGDDKDNSCVASVNLDFGTSLARTMPDDDPPFICDYACFKSIPELKFS